MECYAHGNLPSVHEPEPPRVVIIDSVPKTSNRDPNRPIPEPLLTTGTRVDIDERGRRTLVNAMR